MEWVPMPPFGLILSKNLPTGVRMPMECLKHKKPSFFRIFPGFCPPPGGPPIPPYLPTLGCYAVGSTSGAVYTGQLGSGDAFDELITIGLLSRSEDSGIVAV